MSLIIGVVAVLAAVALLWKILRRPQFPLSLDWLALLPRAEGSVIVVGDLGTGKTSWLMGWLHLTTAKKMVISQDVKWRTFGLPEVDPDHMEELSRLSNGVVLLSGTQVKDTFVTSLVDNAVKLGAQLIVLDDVPVPEKLFQQYPDVRFVIATHTTPHSHPEKSWVCLFKSSHANEAWVSALFKDAKLPQREGQFLLRSTVGTRFDGSLF